MKSRKIWTAALFISTAALITACGNAKTSNGTNNSTENTTSSVTSVSDEDENSMKSVKVYYGWGAGTDEAKYTSEIYCPEGAEFDENTIKSQKENGSVMTVQVSDEVNEYYASSSTHWHRDAYNNEPTNYPIIAQLYFDGEIDAETAKENTGCSQKVTPLGFQWNGNDVMLIETKYTFKDYGESTDYFIGVEYDLDYWKNEEGTGKTLNLTTKSLFGFDITSSDFTTEHYAWIAGQLFGVDSGVANPFVDEAEIKEEIVNVESNDLIGKWLDKESDWEDTYIFNNDGTGIFISGPEYPFTYKTTGNTLTLTFAEDDIEEYTVTVDDSKLVFVDKFNSEQTFEKIVEEEKKDEKAETKTDTENNNTVENSNPNATAVIGTWTEDSTGINETFTFNTDGTGKYSCLSEGETFECDFTYDFLRSDYINIYYSDNTEGGFQIVIDGDKMTVRNETAWDLVYTRQ